MIIVLISNCNREAVTWTATGYVPHRTDNKSSGAQTGVAMGSLYYIPRKSTLLSLFKAARVRLAANGEQARRLSGTRIASATKEINQISDDIRDAKGSGSSRDHLDAATPLRKPADPEVALPITVNVGAAPRAANSKALDPPLQVDKGTPVNLSATAGEGVQWRGEYNALASREIVAFVSQLAALGYSPREFRATVRSVPEGLEGTRRCTVLVAQLRNGVPFRGQRYIGGRGADWIDEFSHDAATTFPRNMSPVPA
jgi:hypothetical protein